jgi:hypothetical protein
VVDASVRRLSGKFFLLLIFRISALAFGRTGGDQ